MSSFAALEVAGLVALVPFVAAGVIAFVPSWRIGGWINCGASTLVFLLACALPWCVGSTGSLLRVDGLAAHVALLTAFVACTTSWFSLGYIQLELASRRLDRSRLRLYHAMYQCFVGGMLLALLSDNLGITWVAIEAATIAAVLVVGLPRTAEAVEASWKFFMVCGVGIALALFGTVLLYLAALPALGAGAAAMSWSGLSSSAARCDGAVLNVAFVFVLLGYGTKAALAPLHAWMPNAHAEGPTPVSAVLGGSILNVALVVIVRLRGVMAANAAAIAPGPPIMALGLFSLLLAAFSLWPRRDVKRFFAYSTIEQSGAVAFAFGLGGPAAMFAGLLHMTLHTLTKASVFQCVGRAAQLKGGQRFADITGLIDGHRPLALTLAAGIVALAPLPPFGLFTSEFLIVAATVQRLPAPVGPARHRPRRRRLGAGGAAAIAVLRGADPGSRSGSVHAGAGAGLAPTRPRHCVRPGDAGTGRGLDDRDRQRRPMSGPASDLIRASRIAPCRPWPRHVLDRDTWAAMAQALAAEPTLAVLALWAETASAHALLLDEQAGAVLPVTTEVVDGVYPALSPHRPGVAWFERMVGDLWGHAASGDATRGPGWTTANGAKRTQWPCARSRPAARRSRRSSCRPRARICIRSRSDRSTPGSSSRAISASPPRARPSSASRRGSGMRTRARSPCCAASPRERRRGSPPGCQETSTVAHSIAFARAAEAALQTEVPPRAQALRAVMAELERVANHLGDVGAICNDASFAFAFARFGYHREAVLRASAIAFGHRLMMDCAVPGGVAADIVPGGPEAVLRCLSALEAELPHLARVYADTASLADRVIGTGVVTPPMAAAFAAGGFVGRASGRDFDARRWPGYPPYTELDLAIPVLVEGDVNARVHIRLAEIRESIRLLRALCGSLPDGGVAATLPPGSGEGIGVAEGFRGDIWHWLRLDNGMIASAFPRDPSWAHWPLLEEAAQRDIVADFPLSNKSFNASYSGVDL